MEQAEAERGAMAEFLQRIRMELSIEKTRITDVGEGFDFLGYRVTQEPALHTGKQVGKLLIPKSKLKQLRRTIKAKVRGTPTGRPLPISSTASTPSSPAGGTTTAMPGGPGGSSPSWTGGWIGASRTGSGESQRRHMESAAAPVSRTQTRGTETLERGDQETAVLQRGANPLPNRGTGKRTDGKPARNSRFSWRRPLLGQHRHPCTNCM